MTASATAAASVAAAASLAAATAATEAEAIADAALLDSEEEDGDEDSPAGKRARSTRSTLPRATTNMLKAWLYDHYRHPYPSDAEKESMARLYRLSLTQINNWFINARRRLLQPLRKEGRDLIVKYKQRLEHMHDESSAACFQALQRCISNIERSSNSVAIMVSGDLWSCGEMGQRRERIHDGKEYDGAAPCGAVQTNHRRLQAQGLVSRQEPAATTTILAQCVPVLCCTHPRGFSPTLLSHLRPGCEPPERRCGCQGNLGMGKACAWPDIALQIISPITVAKLVSP